MQVKWVGSAVVLCCNVCCAGCCPLSKPAHANEAVVYNKFDCLGFLGSSPESVIQQCFLLSDLPLPNRLDSCQWLLALLVWSPQ